MNNKNPIYKDILTKEFFEEYYINQKMSYPQLHEKLLKEGRNIPIKTIHRYAKDYYNIGRNVSESKRTLDYNTSFLTEDIIEKIDGFLLGDGGINPYDGKTVQTGRLHCGQEYEEFCKYQIDMFKCYEITYSKVMTDSMKQGFLWNGRTNFHPDLWQQYNRWYPYIETKGKIDKQPPEDVRITPISVMIWFLGDGSTVIDEKSNTIILRLSTDSFLPEKVEMLCKKMIDKGIVCHRTSYNRIMIDTKGIPAFFNFVGRVSPVKCYDYKFEIPEWRFSTKRMKEVVDELKIDYNRLSYFVKIGKVSCYRDGKKGRPRFTTDHIEEIKKLINSGDLF